MENSIHRFRNNATAIPLANPSFDEARESGLIDLRVKLYGGDRVEDIHGHSFVNLCSCSYLGLHSHPAVLEGAIEALRQEGAVNLSMSRVRLRLEILEQLEEELSALYRVRTITTLSASVAITGVLPLIASGHLGDNGKPRTMVFDKFCHFSMNLVKPICADETEVLTCPHNDLDYLEDLCKKNKHVAYVADGVYSMGGCAPVKELLALQDRYGLMLFFDDSHSLSLWGERGEGYARSFMDEVSPLTIIVVSLNKGFGASGGAVMLGPKQHEDILARFGGPMSWSQGPNVPGIGAARASVRIHASPELKRQQDLMHANIDLFDSLIETEQKGNGLPIKLIRTGSEQRAVECSSKVLARGFYTSAVFFPIVEKGNAGLRVMLRADNTPEDVRRFCDIVREVVDGD